MTTNTIFRDAESGGLNAFIDRQNADTIPDFHLNADMVTAIVQHELGKLGLWWAKEQRALVTTTPDNDGYFLVLELDDLAGGPCWCAPFEAQTDSDPVAWAVAAYLASLPAAPKPGETWEIGTGNESFTAQVIEAPDGTICFVWCPFDGVAIRRVKGFYEGNRRKIADAPTTALDKVRGALAEHPRCDRHGGDDPVTCGWKSAVLDVQAALDGADS